MRTSRNVLAPAGIINASYLQVLHVVTSFQSSNDPTRFAGFREDLGLGVWSCLTVIDLRARMLESTLVSIILISTTSVPIVFTRLIR